MLGRSRFKLNNYSAALKASMALFVANVISKGLSYLTTPIYTRMLSTEEFGTVSIFLTWLQVFGIVAMFCLSQGVFNNGMVEHPNNRDEYSTSMLVLSNLISLVFFIVFILIYPWISSFIKLDIKYLLLMAAIFIFQPGYNFWFTRQRYELKTKSILWSSLLCAVISPAVAVGAIFLFQDHRLEARIFGAEIPLVLVYIIFYCYLFYKSKWSVNISYWKEAFLFNLPLILHYLSMYLLSNSDRIMIANIINNTATAYYTVAYSVASIALIFWNSVNSSLIPYTYEKCKNNEIGDINKVTMPLLYVMALASIIVILLAPEIVSFMATKDYKEAIYVIPPVVGGVFFQSLYSIFANIVYYYKKPIYVTFGSVISVLFNIILNYYFIKKFGYIAAGYTTLFCYILQAFVDYLGMKKVVTVDVYDTKKLCLLSLFVIVISLISFTLYSHSVIRFSLMIVLVFFVFFYRNKIIKTVTMIKT